MPTYQYSCTACDHAFEQVQSFSDDSLTECPECRGRLRKLFNAVGVVFKGSGFYRNDSRQPEKKAAAGPSESGKKESSDSGSGPSKSETRSETKTESKPKADATTSGG